MSIGCIPLIDYRKNLATGQQVWRVHWRVGISPDCETLTEAKRTAADRARREGVYCFIVEHPLYGFERWDSDDDYGYWVSEIQEAVSPSFMEHLATL